MSSAYIYVRWLRIGSALTSIMSVAWIFWPKHNGAFEPQPDAILSFLVSFGSWAYHEFTDWTETATHKSNNGETGPPLVNEADKDILRGFLDFYDTRIESELRDNSFDHIIRTDILEAFEVKAAQWAGVRWELSDKSLDETFLKIKTSIRIFSNSLASNFEWLNASGIICKFILSDEERQTDFHSKQTSERIKKIQGEAEELHALCEEMLRKIKEKCPEILKAK